MLLSFCDVCKNQCSNSPTRRWEHLTGELGLEVIVLRGVSPVGDTHICDECLLNMFWQMLERSPNTGLKQLKFKIASRERECSEREQKIQARETSFEASIGELSNKAKALKEREQLLNSNTLLNEFSQLKNELETVKSRQSELIRQAEARGKQSAIDELENPEYIQSIEARENRRKGAL